MTLSELETLSRIVCLWMATSACFAIFLVHVQELLRREMPADPKSVSHRAREIAHRERKTTPRQTTKEVVTGK